MKKRGYFGSVSLKKFDAVEALKRFFSSTGDLSQITGMLRKSNYRSFPLTDKHALSAWAVRVLQKANKIKISRKYKHGIINPEFMQELSKLSAKENGPILAQEYLINKGIILVVEPHLSKTRLDGATIFIHKDHPIIGLTLRHDRLDNFWFTLMHEISHIVLHYNKDISLFYDELENIKGFDIGIMEKEADELASESLVPAGKWEISPAKLVPSSLAATSLAKELGVHVAIIAGKIRYEGKKWHYLNDIIGKEKVSKYFPKENWSVK
jgi:HTH-type transcriptional regulator/antitoxin HigA